MPITSSYHPQPIFLTLGEGYADPVMAEAHASTRLRFRNQYWAERIGLGDLTTDEWREHFSRFTPLPQNLPQPLALRYHGHQFQHYNPEIGDGRGFLFAQCMDHVDHRILDLATKGTGRTPYSRGGDGCLTLKGAMREALATEMLEALGVNTSKTFSIFETEARLERHDEPSPTRAALLVRLSHSHIRFGTFQRLAYFRDDEKLKLLVGYCLQNYFPLLGCDSGAASPTSTASFFAEIVRRSARLTASWLIAGFVHGVLNTDNMNITGESFDYGPYRFLPKFDPQFTAAYFDHSGLYAYGRQPDSVLWNLQQLAKALSRVADAEVLMAELQNFEPEFHRQLVGHFLGRLGMISRSPLEDGALLDAAFDFMTTSQVGFAQFFHDWHGGALRAEKNELAAYQTEAFAPLEKLLMTYRATPETTARLRDPYFRRQQPCDLLIDEIEEIWAPIATNDDWTRFDAKIAEIRRMGGLLFPASH